MIRVAQIDSVNEVVAKWTRLLSLEKVDAEVLLKTFLKCLENGAVFFVYGDKGLMGYCCVELCGSVAVLQALPRDQGAGMAKQCIVEVKEWAKRAECDLIRVATTRLSGTSRLNGSTFKYFEKSLGFHREAVIFSMEI